MSWIKKLLGRGTKTATYEFDNGDRTFSDFSREYHRELKQIRQEIELERLRHQLDKLKALRAGVTETEQPDSDVDGMFDKMLRLLELNKGAVKDSKRDYSDVELKELLKNTPKEYLKKAKSMSDENLTAILRQQYSDMSDSSILSIVRYIRQ